MPAALRVCSAAVRASGMTYRGSLARTGRTAADDNCRQRHRHGHAARAKGGRPLDRCHLRRAGRGAHGASWCIALSPPTVPSRHHHLACGHPDRCFLLEAQANGILTAADEATCHPAFADRLMNSSKVDSAVVVCGRYVRPAPSTRLQIRLVIDWPTPPSHARICCAGLSQAAAQGPPSRMP